MKRVIRIFFLGLGSVLLLAALMLLGLWLRYRSIVDAVPGQVSANVQSPSGSLVKWVDPFIGTGGVPWMCANNYPGVSRPFGVVRLSPETMSWYKDQRAVNYSGYYYGDNKMLGFSHTRLSGTGARDGGHFLVMPFDGQFDIEQGMNNYYAHFSHTDEAATPGYYAVHLDKPGVFAEFTATQRVGVHRYTFEKHVQPNIFVSITHALGEGRAKNGTIRFLPNDKAMEGSVNTSGTFASRYGGIKVYFAARFNQKFTKSAVWSEGTYTTNLDEAAGDDLMVDLEFSENEKESSIELKLAISHVSIANAWANLEEEAGGRKFNDIIIEGQKAWEEKLSLIQIEGGSDDEKTIFYTSLYRNFQMPTIFTDTNGEYIGFDKKTHKTTDFQYFTDLSLWDTYRTTHPLYNLIARGDQKDMISSLIQMAKHGNGLLPRWPAGHGYTGSMFGSPADMTITEAWLKGIRGFDIEYAFAAMSEAALGKRRSETGFSSRRGIEPYLEYGYCPADLMDKAVSKTLEYAWADHSIGLLARALGKDEQAEIFLAHGQFYRNTWNNKTQYFQPRNADGTFFEPFKPLQLSYTDWDNEYTDDYAEGSAMQWRWGVPHDPEGLISLFSSKDYFVEELNSFFTETDSKIGHYHPGSYYWQGNQPDIFSAYLFNSAERPDLTQKWVRWILENKYDTSYIGLDGNDDGGTLSAWYIFSALGFYPVAGTDKYELGAPLFETARIKMEDKELMIVADNYSPENIYVSGVFLNGSPLGRNWFLHQEIAEGGVLRFEMTKDPTLRGE